MVKLNPYISFKDNTREAMEFYHSVFGGKLELTTFKEGGMPHDEKSGDLIMHSVIENDHGVHFMASDTPSGYEYSKPTGMSISLSGDDATVLKGYWEKLTEGGMITQPLVKSPWEDEFGMFVDKFGIAWMMNILAKK